MNSNRKILCGRRLCLCQQDFWNLFSDTGTVGSINRLGNGNLLVYAAMLLIFCLVFLGACF